MVAKYCTDDSTGTKTIAPLNYHPGDRVEVNKDIALTGGFSHKFLNNISARVSIIFPENSRFAKVIVHALSGSVILAFFESTSDTPREVTPPLWTFKTDSNAPQCVDVPVGAVRSAASWFTLQTHE